MIEGLNGDPADGADVALAALGAAVLVAIVEVLDPRAVGVAPVLRGGRMPCGLERLRAVPAERLDGGLRGEGRRVRVAGRIAARVVAVAIDPVLVRGGLERTVLQP